MAEPIIEAKNLSFSYGDTKILNNLTFSIDEGDYVGIVGPNGGGKTTLLKIILGLLKPDTGDVKIFGEHIHHRYHHHGGAIGYVPQQKAQELFSFPASVREVVASGRTGKRGVATSMNTVDRQAVDAAIHTAHITHLLERRIDRLSGGERQRVLIARALASNPRLLILDEPTTGVDLAAREALYQFLGTVNRTLGITILFVSHDIELMTQEVRTILCLNHNLISHGPAKEFRKQEIEKVYHP